MCALCGPLLPSPLCVRCAVRSAVDWEERGDQFWGRALFATFREALLSPWQLGARLSGEGRLGWAAMYAVCCGLLGAVPLSVLSAALLMTVADPVTLGMRSTSVLSSAVFLVLFTVGAASLLPAVLCVWSALVCGVARAFGVAVRFDVVVRASAYGLSALAVPFFGPLLLPVALVFMMLCLHGALTARAGAARAYGILGATALLFALPLLVWRVG